MWMVVVLKVTEIYESSLSNNARFYASHEYEKCEPLQSTGASGGEISEVAVLVNFSRWTRVTAGCRLLTVTIFFFLANHIQNIFLWLLSSVLSSFQWFSVIALYLHSVAGMALSSDMCTCRSLYSLRHFRLLVLSGTCPKWYWSVGLHSSLYLSPSSAATFFWNPAYLELLEIVMQGRMYSVVYQISNVTWCSSLKEERTSCQNTNTLHAGWDMDQRLLSFFFRAICMKDWKNTREK